MIFNNTHDIPADTSAFLMARFEEAWRSLVVDDQGLDNPRPIRTETFIRWMAPPEGWLVLISDGAAKGAPSPAGGWFNTK